MAKTKKPDGRTADPEPAKPSADTSAEPVMPAAANKPSTPTSAQPTPKIVRSEATKSQRPIPIWVWIVGGLVLVAGATVAGYLYWSSPTTNSTTNSDQNSNVTVVEELGPRIIDGVMVPAAQTNPNLLAVMIENASDSRPPAGLEKASVVYEALAEGGISRFMAIIPVDASVPSLGPLRSARPYYIDWASEYNRPLYIHAGESPQAMNLLRAKSTTVLDLNLLRYSKYASREPRRPAPHNLFSNSDHFKQAFEDLYPKRTTKFTGWLFADDPAIDARPEIVKDLTINYSTLAYKVTYVYDRGQNQYRRLVGDQPHTAADGTQLTAKNVVVQFVATGLYPKEKQRLQMTTVGTGKALIFRNGQTIVGSWKKTAAENRTVFYDEASLPVTLTRGATWVEVVPTNQSVTYQ